MAVANGGGGGLGLGRPGWRASLGVVSSTFAQRMRIILRYRGSFVLEALLPVTFAAMPILLGTAVGGTEAAANFNANIGLPRNAGEQPYRLFMLIGADLFTVVTIMLWVVAFWIRREMESGTLESIYLAPASRMYVVSGITAYAFLRSMVAFVLALAVGAVILGVNPLGGDFALTLGFLLLGLLPLWGLSFVFGALIMKLKEANSVVNLLQWVLAFLMGAMFPLTLLPPVLRAVALAFPPTWLTQDVRASMMGLGYVLGGPWYWDLVAMWAFALVVPLAGYAYFRRTEDRMRRREGVGQF